MDLPNEKPSGLKPPSKIGRPCSSNLPKPAIPQSPKTSECEYCGKMCSKINN